jgi:hypothetical protein
MKMIRWASAIVAVLVGALLSESVAKACAWEMHDSVRFTTNRGYGAPYDVVSPVSPYAARRTVGAATTETSDGASSGQTTDAGGTGAVSASDAAVAKIRESYGGRRYLDVVKAVEELAVQKPSPTVMARAHLLAAKALYRLAVGSEWRGVATGDARAVGYLESAVEALVKARRAEAAGERILDIAHWQCGTLARLGRASDALFACYEALVPTKDGERMLAVLPSLRAVWALAGGADERALQERLLAANADPRVAVEYITHTVYARKKSAVEAKGFLAFVGRWADDRRADIGPWARLRLADLHYRAERYSDAESSATRALAILHDVAAKAVASGSAEHRVAVERGRAHALFVRGAARLHQRERKAAIADFEAYLATTKPHAHEREARQGLAVLYEKAGRPFASLDQYEALGYEADVAYLVDFVMKPAEIARYIEHRPNHKHRAKFRFAIGMHLARAGKFREAAAVFREVLPTLTDADDRARAEKAVATYGELAALTPAKETDASLYAIGAFYYHNRRRVFWNPLFWPNGATFTVQSYAFYEDSPEDGRDHERIRRYFERTNPLWRAREAFLRIVKRFPKSELVPKALYSAATATLRLVTFSSYWRARAACDGFARQARELYRQVREGFSKHALAADAREWEEFADKLPAGEKPRHCK